MAEPRGDELESLRGEADYYRRQVDELGGETLKLDYAISGLRHELRQKRQAFALLSELQQSIAGHTDVSAIFERTIRAVSATLGMDKTVVLVPADREDCYRPSQWLGFPEKTTSPASCRPSSPFPPSLRGERPALWRTRRRRRRR